MFYSEYESPVGTLLLAADEQGLRLVKFPENKRKPSVQADWIPSERHLRDATQQLEEYFAQDRRTFDLPLAPTGTAFQLGVLDQLLKIPYGETRTYEEIAIELGRPKAVRAVGAANGRNPIPIIIPCHRVIGKDGSLTGFGGGLPTKSYLLELEGVLQKSLL